MSHASPHMKRLLLQFVSWLEQVYFQRCPCGSEFEHQLSPVVVIKAEVALEWALASRRPVTLFTSTVSAGTVVAALVLRRAQVSIDNVFKGDLDDNSFDRLTRCLAAISQSGLRLVEGEPPAAMRRATFFNGPVFAISV